MKILIIGAGEVGGHLAKLLSRSNHDITVVDSNADRVNFIGENLDVLAIEGHGTSPSLLRRAQIEKMDMLIAVTTVDEVNILACMIAKQFGVKTKIARVRNREFSSDEIPLNLEELGIDMIIHPELEATREIVRLIKFPQAHEIIGFCGNQMMIVGFRVSEKAEILDVPLQDLGKTLKDIPFRLVTITRDGSTFIPGGTNKVMVDDEVYVAVLPSELPRVFKIFGHERRPTRSVMIYGATSIGRMVAQQLEGEKDIHVKLLESERRRGELAADQLDHTPVVIGDASDINLIAREGIVDQDVFCALTNDDENNIVTSLLARHLQVPKTITLIGKVDYTPIVKTIGLDIAVNPRWLTSNAIFKYIHHGGIVSLRHLVNIDAETFEFIASAKSKVVGKMLRDIKFPHGSIMVAVEHEEGVELPVGDTKIFVGDKVVVFSLPNAVKGVLKLFE
ncbi:Trk system potassium transporter TrkA [bacterium]|nr:Trk system potassium transporter TrkA [bacterium]